jgi:hypothetical protein
MQSIHQKISPILVILIACLFHAPAAAQTDSCRLKIGMNIAGLSDWGSENPFVDLMKSCREWLTANSVWMAGRTNPWDTGIIDSIPRDLQGYPLEIPYTVLGQETTQVVHTVWANTSSLQAGDYICLYDGDGDLEFNFDASVVSQSGNRIVVSVIPHDNIMQLAIRRSNKNNHVRNIRFLMPGSESTYLSQPYNPIWIQQLSPFKTIRFMDWGATNNSPNAHWAERAMEDYYTWTTKKGIPYEEMARLCNTLQADAWVNVPYLADSQYIRQMAILIRDNLDANLKVYVEYSNENWNWMFDQAQYLLNAGDQQVPWPERIVPFIQRVMDTWTDVFQGHMQRLIRVVGGQHYWPDVSRRISLNMRVGSFDAFTPAAYIGFGTYGDSVIASQGSALTPQLVLQLARREMDANALLLLRELKETICDVRNVQLLYYEGGQHLTPNPFGSVQPYNQALEDAQSLPEMYTLYNDWLARLRALTDNSLFMNFSFASSKNGQYGSWGVLEYVGQSIGDAPKYHALIDNLCGSSSVSVQQGNLRPVQTQLEQNYPNPFNPETIIKFYVASAGKVQLIIYDMLGKEIACLFDGSVAAGWHSIPWKSTNMASGLYVCSLSASNIRLTKKMLLLK